MTKPACLALILALASSLPSLADWPQWLGPERNGTSDVALAAWGPEGPSVRWKHAVGAGYSAPVIAQGKVLVFHRQDADDLLQALDPTNGKVLWSHRQRSTYKDDFGFDEGPRSTPTVDGDRVFTYSAEGRLTAIALASGKELWSVDTHRRFVADDGYFGAACSPLVVDDLVVVNVGGEKGGIVAFDRGSGETRWTATDHEASYSSPILHRYRGKAELLVFTREGLVALAPGTGKVRLEFRWRARIKASVNAATPILVGDQVFLSASYGTGAVLLDVSGEAARALWQGDRSLTNHYATSVHHRGTLFGYHGRQEAMPALRAIDAASGEVLWSVDRFGAGSILRVGEKLLILREAGELILAEATPEAFQPLARHRTAPRMLPYPALSDGLLLARNHETLYAFELPLAKAPSTDGNASDQSSPN